MEIEHRVKLQLTFDFIFEKAEDATWWVECLDNNIKGIPPCLYNLDFWIEAMADEGNIKGEYSLEFDEQNSSASISKDVIKDPNQTTLDFNGTGGTDDGIGQNENIT